MEIKLQHIFKRCVLWDSEKKHYFDNALRSEKYMYTLHMILLARSLLEHSFARWTVRVIMSSFRAENRSSKKISLSRRISPTLAKAYSTSFNAWIAQMILDFRRKELFWFPAPSSSRVSSMNRVWIYYAEYWPMPGWPCSIRTDRAMRAILTELRALE